MPQTLQCYKCGAQNMLGVRFCTICGEKFVYRCPQCGANIDPDSEYCSHCAARLDWGTRAEQPANSSLEQDRSVTAQQLEVKEFDKKRKEQPQQRGISPWLIAFIIIVILIVVLFVIDGVVKF